MACFWYSRSMFRVKRKRIPLVIFMVTFLLTTYLLTASQHKSLVLQTHQYGAELARAMIVRVPEVNNFSRDWSPAVEEYDRNQSPDATEYRRTRPPEVFLDNETETVLFFNRDKTNRSAIKIQREYRKKFKPDFDWVAKRLARRERMLGKDLGYGNCTKVLPHAIIFGVMKGGTEALSTFMSIHPQIAMQLKLQTVMFFNYNYLKGVEWYRNQMPCSTEGQLVIEKSPQYFTSKFVPERVHEMNSSIQLIAIMREPISRAISHFSHVQDVKPGLYADSFEDTITDALGRIDIEHETISKSLYSVHLRRWLGYFKMDQIHIVDGDSFKLQQVEELNKIEDFLGIERFINHNHFSYNEEKGFYCLNFTGKPECMGKGKGRVHPKINPGFLEKLRQLFKPYNEELFSIMGKRFDWGY